jgi:hypothetical protein
MKKVTIIFLVAFISSQGNCQFNIELLGGLTSSILKEESSYDNNYTRSYSRRYSGHLGFLAGGKISDYSGLRSGLIYASRGAVLEDSGILPFSGYSVTKLKLDYLEIPLLYSFEPSSFRIFIGPQYATLLFAKVKGDDTNQDSKSILNSGSFELRYGFSAHAKSGLGYQLHIISGLSDILKSEEYSWKGNSINLSLSYAVTRSNSAPTKSKAVDIPHRIID